MKSLSGPILALCLLLSTVAQAQLFKRDPGDEIVQPDEEALQLPASPKDENLIEFDPVFQTNLLFYVDSASLKVGESDRIVRYTLVVRSASGASNVTYEALRCDTLERKIYAYGLPDGDWNRVREPKWAAVDKDKEVYRHTLFHQYFCPRMVVIRDAAEGVEALRRGGHWRLQSY